MLLPDVSEDKLIAVDSRAIQRSWVSDDGTKKSFKGLIGVSISVFNEENFKGKYEEILQRLFTQFGLTKEKMTYKSAEIFSLFYGKPWAAQKLLFDFSYEILSLKGLRINIFYTTFDSKPLASRAIARSGDVKPDVALENSADAKIVPIFGRDSALELISVRDFVNKVDPYYPVICAWKLSEFTKMKGQHFLLDSVSGYISKAWEDLITGNDIHIVTKGDQCNPYISCADLLLRGIERSLEKKLLNHEAVSEVILNLSHKQLQAEVRYFWVTNPDIEMIRPIKKELIIVDYFAQHPVFCIFNEESVSKEKIEIENSPMMKSIFNRAYELNGSVLFYTQEYATRILRDNDFFVYYGENGELAYKRLRNLGYNLIPNKWGDF